MPLRFALDLGVHRRPEAQLHGLTALRFPRAFLVFALCYRRRHLVNVSMHQCANGVKTAALSICHNSMIQMEK